MRRKILEVNEEMSQILTSLCDASLKFSGLSMHIPVTKLINSIVEEEIPTQEGQE